MKSALVRELFYLYAVPKNWQICFELNFNCDIRMFFKSSYILSNVVAYFTLPRNSLIKLIVNVL